MHIWNSSPGGWQDKWKWLNVSLRWAYSGRRKGTSWCAKINRIQEAVRQHRTAPTAPTVTPPFLQQEDDVHSVTLMNEGPCLYNSMALSQDCYWTSLLTEPTTDLFIYLKSSEKRPDSGTWKMYKMRVMWTHIVSRESHKYHILNLLQYLVNINFK